MRAPAHPGTLALLLSLGYPQADARDEAERVARTRRPMGPSGQPTVQCAWCGLVMREGDPAVPATHGICGSCERAVDAEDEAAHQAGP